MRMRQSDPFRRTAARWLPAFLLAHLAGCAARERDEFVALRNVPAESSPWSYGGREGRKLVTEHYEIFTTLRDQRLIDSLPQAMETTYAWFQRLAPVPDPPRERMPVYLFADRDDWTYFTRRNFPQKAALLTKVRNGGYTEGSTAVIEYVAHQVTVTVMAHEGMHQYLHHCVRQRVPAWLNEGLAVLCEGQRWDADGLRGFDPWFNPARRNALAEALLRNDLYPLEELLRINAGHVVGGPTRGIATYYAQVWALLLFLREGEQGKYAEGFRQLMAALPDEKLEARARAAFVTSDRPEYDMGTGLFMAFISPEIEAVDAEYARFMGERVLGQR